MNLEQTFLQFLKDWLAWAEADAPEHEAFSIQDGLCRASKRFDFTGHLKAKVKAELRKDKGSSLDPFKWYASEDNGPSHKWEPRLKWVRNKIKELEQCA